MSFKSPHQPLCRCCADPIAKATQSVYPNGVAGHGRDTGIYSKADAQALTNGVVVAVSYSQDYEDLYRETPKGPKYVRRFSVWDGESYIDEFFCKGACAIRFAYVMAREGMMTVAYDHARKKEMA